MLEKQSSPNVNIYKGVFSLFSAVLSRDNRLSLVRAIHHWLCDRKLGWYDWDTLLAAKPTLMDHSLKDNKYRKDVGVG